LDTNRHCDSEFHTLSSEDDEMDALKSGNSSSSYVPSDLSSRLYPDSEEAQLDIRTTPAQLLPTLPNNRAAPIPLPEIPIPPDQSPLGKIRVNDNTYKILEVIFSTHGLVGQGTVCYLTKKNGEEYIVKDHWILRNIDDIDVLNEITMIEKMKGVPGVSVLVEYCWVVSLSDNIDKTRKYHYKEFPSLVSTKC
jgi:hypothetical protein